MHRSFPPVPSCSVNRVRRAWFPPERDALVSRCYYCRKTPDSSLLAFHGRRPADRQRSAREQHAARAELGRKVRGSVVCRAGADDGCLAVWALCVLAHLRALACGLLHSSTRRLLGLTHLILAFVSLPKNAAPSTSCPPKWPSPWRRRSQSTTTRCVVKSSQPISCALPRALLCSCPCRCVQSSVAFERLDFI
jgi:hypothetical protein